MPPDYQSLERRGTSDEHNVCTLSYATRPVNSSLQRLLMMTSSSHFMPFRPKTCLYPVVRTNPCASGMVDLSLTDALSSNGNSRDLSAASSPTALKAVGSLSSHRRPVEALASHVADNGDLTLFTSDSAGLINAWSLRFEGDIWRATSLPEGEMRHHRTGVTEMVYGDGHLWSCKSASYRKVVHRADWDSELGRDCTGHTISSSRPASWRK